jgi:hypothetical protein
LYRRLSESEKAGQLLMQLSEIRHDHPYVRVDSTTGPLGYPSQLLPQWGLIKQAGRNEPGRQSLPPDRTTCPWGRQRRAPAVIRVLWVGQSRLSGEIGVPLYLRGQMMPWRGGGAQLPASRTAVSPRLTASSPVPRDRGAY